MNTMKSDQTEMKPENRDGIKWAHDEDGDILEIFFGENKPATGIELTDHILLRLNPETQRAVSLTFLHFSILTERTEYGPRSYPMDKLEELPEDLRESAIRAMSTAPVNQFLKLSFFQESPTKRVPLTYVENALRAQAA